MTYSCDSDDGFKEPYYDFDSELTASGGGGRRTRVGFSDGPAKARPKSACSVRGRRDRQTTPARCHSALGLRHGVGELHEELVLSPSNDEVPGGKSCIKNFRRSLKLLGLQLEGFNLEAGEPSPKPDIKNAKSKVGSLVTRRSVSLEDLHEAVVSVGFPLTPDVENLKHRKILAKAIYEEWYFKKQEEEEKKKSEARQQQRVKQWELQHRKYDQMRKSQECFKEWLHKKRKQQQDHQLRTSIRGPTKPTYSCNPVTSQKAQSAYESWKKEKEKLLKKQQQESKLHKKMMEERSNGEDSEKAYQEWKKKADKEWFARMKQIENKVKELEKEEEKQMLEKKKCAELAYKGWLETKETELKKKLKDARQAHLEAQKRRATRHSNRLCQSQQAFLAWLDAVEKRFCEELANKQNHHLHLAAGD